MYDVLIVSSSKKEHIKHVQSVFRAFRKKIEGRYINYAGISPSSSKVEAIENFLVPDTMRKLKQFLGIVIFITEGSCLSVRR